MKYIKTILFTATMLIFSSATWAEHDFIKNTQRIGVLSVTMTKVGDDRQTNQDTRNAILEHANTSFTNMLKSLKGWEIVPATEIAKLDGVKQINKMAGQEDIKKSLNKLADQDKLPIEDDSIQEEAMAAALSFNKDKMEKLRVKAVNKTEKEMQAKVRATTKNRQALSGLPALSLGAVEGYFGDKPETQSQIKLIEEIFEKRVSDFCKKNNLDGVAIFYINAEAGHVGDVFVINNNRVNGHVKANTSIHFLHKNRKFNYSHGYPRMDDLAPFYLNTPIYIGTSHDYAKPENIDLADPAGETLKKYKELIDKANSKLDASLRKKLKI